MPFRSSVATIVTLLAIVLATCVSAQPTKNVEKREDVNWCDPILTNPIGGPGWLKMWEGAEGPHSWTSGHHGNNIFFDDSTLRLKLHSGDHTDSTNLYYIKINEKGQDGYYLHGFSVAINEVCYVQLRAGIVKPHSTFYMASTSQ